MRWDRAIENELRKAHVLIAVIGRSWASHPNLEKDDDVLRNELRFAVDEGLPGIVLCVDGRRSLTKEDLVRCPELEPMLLWQSKELRTNDWDDDIVKLHGDLMLIGEKVRLAHRLGLPAGWDRDGGPGIGIVELGDLAVVRDAPLVVSAPDLPPPAVMANGPAVGVLGDVERPIVVALRGDRLVLQKPDGVEVAGRTIGGATSTALSPDGRVVVVGTASGFVPVQLSGSKLLPLVVSEVPDLGPVLATWSVGDARFVASARPADGLQVRRTRDWDAASGWEPGVELGPAAGWVAYVQHRDTAASVDRAGVLRTAGGLASAFDGAPRDGWIDLDLAAMDGVGGVVAGLRTDHDGRTELIVAVARGSQWAAATAVDVGPTTAVHVARTAKPGVGSLVLLEQDGLLRGWSLQDLLPDVADT